MAHSNLASVPPEDFPQQQFEALTEAHKLLAAARIACVTDASDVAWHFLNHAAKHLARQADALVRPVFAAPPEELAESFIESTLQFVTRQLEVR